MLHFYAKLAITSQDHLRSAHALSRLFRCSVPHATAYRNASSIVHYLALKPKALRVTQSTQNLSPLRNYLNSACPAVVVVVAMQEEVAGCRAVSANGDDGTRQHTCTHTKF